MTGLSPETHAAMDAVSSDPSVENIRALCMETWLDGYNGALLDAAAVVEESIETPDGAGLAVGFRAAASIRDK